MTRRINILFLVIIGTLLSAKVSSQVIPRQSNSEARILFENALNEFKEKRVDNAINIAEQALLLTEVKSDFNLLGNFYFLLGQCFESKNEFENSIRYYIRSTGALEKINDPNVFKVLKQTGTIFSNLSMFEKASEYFTKATDFRKLNNQPVDPELLEDLAYALYFSGHYQKSELRFRELLEYSEKEKKEELALRSLYNLAEITLRQQKYIENLQFNQFLLDHFERTNDKIAMSLVSNNMGYTNLKLANHGEALVSFQTALKIGQESGIEEKKKSQLMSNIGICYQNLGELDNSIKHLRQSNNIAKSLNDYEETARLENIIAQVYLLKKDLYNAGQFSLSSIESARQSGNKRILMESYHTYSRILKQGNDHIRALEYYELYLSLLDSLTMEQRLYEQTLAQRILDLEKSEKELKLILADEELKDLELKNLQIESEKKEQEIELLRRERELEISERQRIMQSLELSRERHEAEIRQKEIHSLEQEKEISDLLIKQKEAEEKERKKEIRLLENEKELQQLEIEKQKEARKRISWMLALFAAIIILVLVSFVVVRKKNLVLAQQKLEIEEKNFDLEQKNEEIKAQSENLQTAYEEIQTTNEMLEQKSEEILTQNEQIIKQNELIEERNKNITDSIYYASRIQTAVLPPEDFLEPIFKDSFLLFKPKDIVSGDFYWASTKGKYHIIAAADCTGHGVPGAFMSMLGITLLNEIVTRTKDFTASKLLDQLRAEVIHSLKQKGVEGETKDGMDISLCVVDTENLVLHYAGANNPLYFFSNKEMTVFPPDKMPIGISHQEMNLDSNFTNNQIKINSSDAIYLFTDGFADQFGGPLGKKFKYTKFRETLKKIHHLPMNDQKEKLNEVFENWKGKTDQIDDVLVIGVRL